MSANPERPVGKLRAVTGKESAYRTMTESLERMQIILPRIEYAFVEAQAIASMIRSGIAEVCS